MHGLASILLFAVTASARSGEGGPRPPAWIHAGPSSIELPGGDLRPAQNSIARSLDEAGPGTVIFLDPGTYPAFTIGFVNNSRSNARTSGGAEGAPVVVEGVRGTRIVGENDTIAIDQRVKNAWITFRNLVIVPGQRAGVMFFKQGRDSEHRGYSFEDCHILGGFDHRTGEGRISKWGIWGHSLAEFRFVGVNGLARVEGIAREHGFYLQNHRGSILIENVRATQLGRTFCQFTARAREGEAIGGDITIRGCRVEDVGLASGDGHKGGSAFTFSGRLNGTIVVENNVYKAGFRGDFRPLTLGNTPYGTGALVAWQGGEATKNDVLVLRDNRFLFAEGCGDRPVVAAGGCRKVLVVGKNEFVSGGRQPALALDPVDDDRRLRSSPNGSAYVAPATLLKGDLTVRGKKPSPEELAKLRREG